MREREREGEGERGFTGPQQGRERGRKRGRERGIGRYIGRKRGREREAEIIREGERESRKKLILSSLSLSFSLQTAQSRSQFGVALSSLVPPDSSHIPAVLEKCLQYIEDHGQYNTSSTFSRGL